MTSTWKGWWSMSLAGGDAWISALQSLDDRKIIIFASHFKKCTALNDLQRVALIAHMNRSSWRPGQIKQWIDKQTRKTFITYMLLHPGMADKVHADKRMPYDHILSCQAPWRR